MSDICPICHSECKIPLVAPCGHTYCTVCIMRYLAHESSCFVCRQPLAKRDLKMKPMAQGGAGEEDERWKCPICSESLQRPVISHCGHIFCGRCIRTWLERKCSCPICNSELHENGLIRVYENDTEYGDDDGEGEDEIGDEGWAYAVRNELGLAQPRGRQRKVAWVVVALAALFFMFSVFAI